VKAQAPAGVAVVSKDNTAGELKGRIRLPKGLLKNDELGSQWDAAGQ